MQPTAAAHAAAAAAAHATSNHNHLVNVHYPEHAPPSLTPRRRGCGCTLGLIALLLVLLFMALLALESPFIALENSRIASRMRAAPYRHDHPPTPAAELRLRLPRRPESAAARAAARTAARAAAHAAAHAEAPGSPPRCRGAHEREASRVGGGELHPAPLSPHAAAAAAGTEADDAQVATVASGSLAAAGTQMLAAGRPPPLLLRGTREEHLAQAAALYTRERQERTSTALILTLSPALAPALNLNTLTRAVAVALALFLSPALSLALVGRAHGVWAAARAVVPLHAGLLARRQR